MHKINYVQGPYYDTVLFLFYLVTKLECEVAYMGIWGVEAPPPTIFPTYVQLLLKDNYLDVTFCFRSRKIFIAAESRFEFLFILSLRKCAQIVRNFVKVM